MGHLGGSETRFEQGKEAVRQLIKGSVSGDGYSLISLSNGGQSDLIAPTFRQDSFLAELDRILVTELPIDLNGAFARLESLLIESPQPQEKEILIVSDFQQKDWSPTGSKRQNLETRLARIADENVRFTLVNGGGRNVRKPRHFRLKSRTPTGLDRSRIDHHCHDTKFRGTTSRKSRRGTARR